MRITRGVIDSLSVREHPELGGEASEYAVFDALL